MRPAWSTADVKKIRQLHNDLYEAFIWSLTPQGHQYWADIAQNLTKLAKDAEKGE